jgi:hypothetical protein
VPDQPKSPASRGLLVVSSLSSFHRQASHACQLLLSGQSWTESCIPTEYGRAGEVSRPGNRASCSGPAKWSLTCLRHGILWSGPRWPRPRTTSYIPRQVPPARSRQQRPRKTPSGLRKPRHCSFGRSSGRLTTFVPGQAFTVHRTSSTKQSSHNPAFWRVANRVTWTAPPCPGACRSCPQPASSGTQASTPPSHHRTSLPPPCLPRRGEWSGSHHHPAYPGEVNGLDGNQAPYQPPPLCLPRRGEWSGSHHHPAYPGEVNGLAATITQPTKAK